MIVTELAITSGSLSVNEWPADDWAPAPVRTVVALHGLRHAGAVWAGMAASLAGPVRLVAPDLRGHGDSLRSGAETYQLEQLVDDALAVIGAHTCEPPVLIGHSLGGRVAAEIALRGLAPLAATVLIDVSPEIREEARRRMVDLHGNASPDLTAAEFRQVLAERHPFARPSLLSLLAQATTAPHPYASDRVAEQTDRSFVDAWLAGAFDRTWPHRIARTPIVAVRGVASSVLSKRAAMELLAAGTVDKVVEVPRAGHDVPLDNPSALAEVVRHVIESVTTH